MPMCPGELANAEKQRIYEVKGFILNHLEQQFTIRQLARMAALGRQKFRDGFFQLFEINAGEYVHEARMQTGKFLLTKTDKSIKEIAILCGYSKARNFSSAYRKYFEIRPRDEKSRER